MVRVGNIGDGGKKNKKPRPEKWFGRGKLGKNKKIKNHAQRSGSGGEFLTRAHRKSGSGGKFPTRIYSPNHSLPYALRKRENFSNFFFFPANTKPPRTTLCFTPCTIFFSQPTLNLPEPLYALRPAARFFSQPKERGSGGVLSYSSPFISTRPAHIFLKKYFDFCTPSNLVYARTRVKNISFLHTFLATSLLFCYNRTHPPPVPIQEKAKKKKK